MGCFPSKKNFKKPEKQPERYNFRNYYKNCKYEATAKLGEGLFVESRRCTVNDEKSILKRYDKRAYIGTNPEIFGEFTEDEYSYFILTQEPEGMSLLDYILRNKNIPERNVIEIIRKLLLEVAKWHSRNIIIRDLNLLSIQINSDLDVRIGNVGLRYTKRLFPQYLAPEVIVGELSEKCDIWSCGVILYVLLTGAFPYQGRTEEEIVDNIRLYPLNFDTPIEGVPPEAQKLLKQLLVVDDRARISPSIAASHPWVTSTPVKPLVFTIPKTFVHAEKLREGIYKFIGTTKNLKQDSIELRKDLGENKTVNIHSVIEYFGEMMPEEVYCILKTISEREEVNCDEFVSVFADSYQAHSKILLRNIIAGLDESIKLDVSAEEIRSIEASEPWEQIAIQIDQLKNGLASANEFYNLIDKLF